MLDLRTLLRTLPALVLLSWIAPAPFAGAQIDLPSKGARPPKPVPAAPRQRGNVAPHIDCTICGTRNYTAPRTNVVAEGLYQAYCALCRRTTIHRDPAAQRKGKRKDRGKGGLDLPSRPVRLGGRVAPRSDAIARRPASEPAKAAGVATDSGGRAGPAAAERPSSSPLLQSVRGVRDLEDEALERAADELAGDPEGLAAARAALGSDDPATLLVALRALVRAGDAAAIEAAIARLETRLPRGVGPRVLKELLERDPVHGTPELCVRLLSHPQQPMRATTERLLAERLTSDLAPALAEASRAKRDDTRLRAIRLLARLPDPGVVDVFLDHLADSSARVVSTVAEELARRDAEHLDLLLAGRAFESRWVLRENACALLAVIDREDERLEPILDERHVEPLLGGLSSSDPFVRGACAAALAGIGFRAPSVEGTEWLDREVIDHLVYAVSGKEFHPDFPALLPRAVRRLERVSGQSFGQDGPRWVDWWLQAREGFHALRAWLLLDEHNATRLVLSLGGELDEGPFVLFGPDLARADVPAAGEALRLTVNQCRELTALLAREGVLGPARLPGRLGATGRGARSLEIALDGHGKRFEIGPNRAEPWFERIAAAARDLRRRNRWQRYPDLERYSGERAFWEDESGWWSLEHTEAERGRRLVELILRTAGQREPGARTAAVRELEELYGVSGVPSPDDFEPLVALLDAEPFLCDRARRLCGLALRAGVLAEAPQGEPVAGPLPLARARTLLDVLERRFGADAAPELGLVCAAAGRAFTRTLAHDEDPLRRAVACATLAEGAEPEDVELLLAALDDPAPEVAAAAATALGGARIEQAREPLLVRARVAEPAVRAAALVALGSLGGEYVIDALLVGLADRDPRIQSAAAEGLARLGDPSAAPLLASLLSKPHSDPAYRSACRGLERLGRAAWPELERLMRSPLAAGRRDAAVLLARQGHPEVVGPLIAILHQAPRDREVAFELAVATCVDFRGADDPAQTWTEWWRTVRHDDPLAWLLAAADRRGIALPPREALEEGDSPAARRLFAALLVRDEDFLIERARRELVARTGFEIEPAPRDPAGLQRWREEVLAALGEDA